MFSMIHPDRRRSREFKAKLVELIVRQFDYDPVTGLINRKRNGETKVTWAVRKDGYSKVGITYAPGMVASVTLQQIAWIVTTGRYPVGEIDHINRNPQDNRLANLREVNSRQNGMNKSRPVHPNLPSFAKAHPLANGGVRYQIEKSRDKRLNHDVPPVTWRHLPCASLEAAQRMSALLVDAITHSKPLAPFPKLPIGIRWSHCAENPYQLGWGNEETCYPNLLAAATALHERRQAAQAARKAAKKAANPQKTNKQITRKKQINHAITYEKAA